MQLVNILSHAIATRRVPRRRPAPHRGRALRRLRREPDDRAPRHRRAARPRRREHRRAAAAPSCKPPQLAAATFELERVPRPARRPARRGAGAGGARACRPARAPPPTSPSPEGTRVISIRRLLQRGDEPLFYHRESLVYDPTRAHGRGRARRHRPARPVRGRRRHRAQARRAHHPRLGPHRAEEARHVERPPGTAALGARAPLLRLRRPAHELGPVRLPRRPAAVSRPRRARRSRRRRRGAARAAETP